WRRRRSWSRVVLRAAAGVRPIGGPDVLWNAPRSDALRTGFDRRQRARADGRAAAALGLRRPGREAVLLRRGLHAVQGAVDHAAEQDVAVSEAASRPFDRQA